MKQVKGREVIVGATMDPVFGPTVMYGLGGVMVEALKDVSFRIAPVTWADTDDMLSEVKGSVILGDFRGKKAVDIGSVKHAIMALGDLMVRCPKIKEIEINPLFATPEGAICVDCRVRVEN
jgi:acyl-CoA synthetase (NDP forming)